MRKLSILILLFGIMSFEVPTRELTWHTDLDLALATAKKEKKVLLVNFTGSDWCYWCKRLSAEVFTQPEFDSYAKENLVLVKLDFPRANRPANYNDNVRLAQQYQVEGFPTILLMDPAGKILLRTGYQRGGAASYVKHLQRGSRNYAIN